MRCFDADAIFLSISIPISGRSKYFESVRQCLLDADVFHIASFALSACVSIQKIILPDRNLCVDVACIRIVHSVCICISICMYILGPATPYGRRT